MHNQLDILKEYSQKSGLFLFPLLNVKANIKPLGTYFKIKGFDNGNKNLICLFYNKEVDYKTVKAGLIYLEEFELVVSEGDYDTYVFNMNHLGDDYDKILNGCYSKINQRLKVKITCKDTKSLALRGLYPDQFYEEYAELLEVNVEQLTGSELLSLPDMLLETLNVEKQILEKLKLEYAI